MPKPNSIPARIFRLPDETWPRWVITDIVMDGDGVTAKVAPGGSDWVHTCTAKGDYYVGYVVPCDPWDVPEDAVEGTAELITCMCGIATGVPCLMTPTIAEAVTVEWMPPYFRASHIAAGGAGQWPHDGSTRLRVSPDCAEELVEAEPQWTSPVE